MRLALLVLLLASCSPTTIGGYQFIRVPQSEPIYLNGRLVRAKVECLKRRITVHENDEAAELHEVRHAADCCELAEDCRQD